MSDSVLKDLATFNKTKPRRLSPHPLFDNFGAIINKEQACENLQISTQCNYVLFFGFIREYKGLDLLLKAFSDSRLKPYNLKLIIAGEFYSDAGSYHKLIEDLGIKDQLLLKTDFIKDEEVVNYFCASDLVVQPYKHATQSGVTQIAYHFEVPMIVTKVGGLPELVPDGEVGFCVEPNAEAIADAIFSFFNQNLKRNFINGIRFEKPKYAWSKMVDAIEGAAYEVN
jgi:D-inositol-3-phosphate glycosyltransferase